MRGHYQPARSWRWLGGTKGDSVADPHPLGNNDSFQDYFLLSLSLGFNSTRAFFWLSDPRSHRRSPVYHLGRFRVYHPYFLLYLIPTVLSPGFLLFNAFNSNELRLSPGKYRHFPGESRFFEGGTLFGGKWFTGKPAATDAYVMPTSRASCALRGSLTGTK